MNDIKKSLIQFIDVVKENRLIAANGDRSTEDREKASSFFPRGVNPWFVYCGIVDNDQVVMIETKDKSNYSSDEIKNWIEKYTGEHVYKITVVDDGVERDWHVLKAIVF